LLDTSDAEDMAITAKPMIELSKNRKWEEESDEPEEEKEEAEERPSSGWRPGGLDETLERAAKSSEAAPDWRDEAFHGNKPTSSFPAAEWEPSDPQPSFAEAIESQTVAVATVENKPAGETSPFTSDAWAAAMAAGIEEKLGATTEVAPPALAAEAAPERHEQPAESIVEASTTVPQPVVAEPAPAMESMPSGPCLEPANWSAAPETAWDVEAKKASLLASTWDAPKPFSNDETQEIPVYSAEPGVEHAETPSEPKFDESPYSAEPVIANESEEQSQIPASEVQESFAVQASESKNWETTEDAPVTLSSEPATEEPPAAAPASEEAVPEPVAAAQPDMDELVARVLGRMNPEVLQKVTREILKPVIEAIVRDEIASKKS
jgi:hypothetical protein